MKICLVQKKAFLEEDKPRVRELEFRRKAKLAKIDYKNKVKQKLISGKFMGSMARLEAPKPAGVACSDPAPAKKLHAFFTRFNRDSTTTTWAPPKPPAPT